LNQIESYFLVNHPKLNQTVSNLIFISDEFLSQNWSKPNLKQPVWAFNIVTKSWLPNFKTTKISNIEDNFLFHHNKHKCRRQQNNTKFKDNQETIKLK
jgi:hypothetical protein